MGLSVVEGRLSDRYNHFAEYSFMSCQATETRLMGVVALKVTWRGKDRPRARYYQIIHLDYSEYGVDEYLEFECIPGTDTYKQNKEEADYYWNHFAGIMGGDTVNIPASVMLQLIDMALPLTGKDIDREYDNKVNEEFREYAVMRFEMMREALASEGVTSDLSTPEDAMRAVMEKRLGTCAVINYFIMRIVDRDFDAACMLSTIGREELAACELAEPGIQTLIRSNIKKSNTVDDPPADGASHPYRCTITTLGRKGYYHSTFVVYLDGDYRTKDSLITQFEMGTMLKLSEYESAIQVARREYLTVIQCPDDILNGFDGRFIAPLENADPTVVPNGWLYTVYNKDNSHVNRTEYRIDNDVYGYALLSIGGELVLMSHDMMRINMLDNAAMMSVYAPKMTVKGRYMIDTPIFHTLYHSHGAYFEDLIEPAH